MTSQNAESDPSDLDISLGDATPLGTPPKEVVTPPKPPGQS